MSLSLCLYVCCKHRPLYQNQIFKIPITFYNARRQQTSRTVELVDHTNYDGRRVARRTHTSVDGNALTALLHDLLWVCCGPCSYNCAAVDKILFDIACRAVCLQYKSFLVTVGTEKMCRRQDHSFFGCHQSRSFYVISVLRKCFLGCVFQIFCNLFLGKS